MGEIVESHEFSGRTVQIVVDDYPSNPMENDTISQIIHWHRRYDLGEDAPEDLDGIEGVREWIEKEKNGTHIKPLFIYDHSGITVWIGDNEPFINSAHRGWDTGQVGFVFTTPEQIELMGTPEERVDAVIAAEVKDFDQYLRGEGYGYEILDGDGEVEESCYGFYDLGDVVSDAKAVAAGMDPLHRHWPRHGRWTTRTDDDAVVSFCDCGLAIWKPGGQEAWRKVNLS